jgi:methionine sulfoxide reductase heme-binding subunit
MRVTSSRGLWLLVHLALLTPAILLIWDFTNGRLTADPIQAATLRTGKTALSLLVLCLACTPVYTATGLGQLLGLRRALGLYAFAYAALHVTVFVWLDYGFDLSLMREAVLEKPYALAGLAAFLLLVPLAVTSTWGWRRRLGPAWTALHRAIYVAALMAVVHFLWSVKADTSEPLGFGAAVLLLLLLRLPSIRKLLGGWRYRLLKSRRSAPVKT